MSAETNDKTEKATAKTAAKPTQTTVHLVPANDSDRPMLANYVSLQPASGMLLLDFGFLESAVLAALPNVARRRGKLPESLNGRLAVWVAMGYESAVQLQNPLTRQMERRSKVAQAGKRDGEKGRG